MTTFTHIENPTSGSRTSEVSASDIGFTVEVSREEAPAAVAHAVAQGSEWVSVTNWIHRTCENSGQVRSNSCGLVVHKPDATGKMGASTINIH